MICNFGTEGNKSQKKSKNLFNDVMCFNKCCEKILTDKEFLVRAAEDNAQKSVPPGAASPSGAGLF